MVFGLMLLNEVLTRATFTSGELNHELFVRRHDANGLEETIEMVADLCKRPQAPT